jgi:gluconolactonase
VAVVASSPVLLDLIDPSAELELLADTLRFGEGPVWNAREQCLYFSSIGQDRRLRWSERAGVTEVNSPNNKGNGMTYDADLNLLICEHATSVVARERAGVREIVADSYQGKELNSPNDVVVAADGSVYFTDPFYGRLDHVFGLKRDLQLDFCGVYRAGQDGGLTLLDRELREPNGLCFSPDEAVLYVNDSKTGEIWAYDHLPGGGVANKRLFAGGMRTDRLRDGIVDGMKCDVHGNVWVTAPGGLRVFTPAAECLGVIESPEIIGNFHWGGPGWDQLFICTWHALYRLQTRVTPALEPFMRNAG